MASGYYLEFKNPTLRVDPHQRLIKILNFTPLSNYYNYRYMSFTRYGGDAASPKLAQSASNGTVFGEVILTAFRSDRAGEKDLVTYTMKQATVSALKHDTLDGRVIETFDLSAEQILLSGHRS